MSDTAQLDVTPAESSTAPVTATPDVVELEAPSPSPLQSTDPVPFKSIDEFTPEEFKAWQEEGKYPGFNDTPPKTETESAPVEAKPSGTEAKVEQTKAEDESVPESETGTDKQDGVYKPKTAARINELLEDRKYERAENERLREELRQLRETGVKTDSPPPVKDATGQSGELSLETFDGTVAEFVQAVLAQEKAKEAAARAKESADTKLRSKIEEGRKAHKDFDQVFTERIPELQRLMTPVMAEYVLDSEAFPDLARELGQNTGEIRRIAALTPIQQVRELTKLETRLSDAKTPKAPPATPARPVTAAPPPPTSLGTQNAGPPEDEAVAAVKRGDTATYIRVMNAREAAGKL